MDFLPTVKNNFLKISTNSDSISETGLLCSFISKSAKNDEVKDVFVLKI